MTTPETAASATSPCGMTLDFSEETEVSQWRTVLDGVMGGRSSGARYAEDDHMVFRGVINTNGGGFSSIRRSMVPGQMAGAENLRLRVKSDGRAYKLSFRTSENRYRRPVSYQIPIPQTPPGEWTTITAPLRDFNTTIFGRRVKADPFDASDVREMGIILADGIDGPFRIEVAELGCAAVKAT